jgi:hypothetical protein
LGPVANSFGRPGEDIEIVLDGRGCKVIDTLNEIVVQVPNLAWVVTTSERKGSGARVTSFGFLDGKGSRVTLPLPAS